MGVCAGGLVLLLLVFAVEEHVRGRLALNAHLSRLRASGEVYSVAALEPKHLPADQNAFLDLTNIAGKLEPMVKHLDDAPPPLRFAAPGKEIVAWRLNQWGRNTKITNDWSRLGPELEEARSLLDLLHAAVQKPAYDSGFDYKQGFLDTQLNPIEQHMVRRGVLVLQAATLYDLHRGNLAAASRCLCDLVRLVAVQKPEPVVSYQHIRRNCESTAFDVTWQALQTPGWNDAQFAALQAAWDFDFARDMASAIEMERAMTFDSYEQIKNSRAKLLFTINEREAFYDQEGCGSLPAHGFVLRWVYLPFWHLAWADQQELFALNEYEFEIEHERIARTNSVAALPKLTEAGDEIGPLIFFGDPMDWYDRLRMPFAQEGFTISDEDIRQVICAQVEQEMAVSAIALQRYRLQTGKFPADLAALVPKYLSALPRDGMDSKTLRYRLKPDGGFVFYSVGLDGKDDGGDSTLATDKYNFNQIWDCRDAVWPSPATDEEALAAMKSAKN
jgi:hypothetical protein